MISWIFCILRKDSDTDIITCYRSAARDFLDVGKRVYREDVRHITEILFHWVCRLLYVSMQGAKDYVITTG